MNISSGFQSGLYKMASKYLLPASLVLFTLSLDPREIWKLRRKAGLMFITGTVGIIIGGPLAVLLVSVFSPETVGGAGPDAVWRGLSTVAGSWIGCEAMQQAMYRRFKPSPVPFLSILSVGFMVYYLDLG